MAMAPALLIYLFKANLSLGLFCCLYYLLLRRLTFVMGNRWFLLGGALCALLLPLVPVDALLTRHETLQQAVIYYLPSLPAPRPATPLIWQMATFIFWAGITVMVIRFLLQLYSLHRLHRSARRRVIAGYRVHALQKKVSPFSFFRNIYLNPDLHAPQVLPGILRHETVHVRQWHTLDIMAGSLVQIFAWFNPAAWLLQHAIRENLEFITDRTLLREGMNPQQYQFSLLEVNGIPTATAIANNFNFSSLKNRIKMMNKKRSPQYQALRYIIPVITAAVLVLILNASRASLLPVKEKLARLAAPVLHPAQDTSQPAQRQTVQVTATLAPADSVLARKGVVTIVPRTADTLSAKPGTSVTVTGNGNSRLAITPNGKRTAQTITVVSDTTSDTLQLLNPATTAPAPGHQPLYIIGGKLATDKELKALDGRSIESINVLKGAAATDAYGAAAVNGVVIVNIKK
ncbi:MAG TPA: M56 family metallopeptidase [Chitinophaga sp.]